MAALFLGERLTSSQAVGAGLVVGAVVLVSLSRAKGKTEPAVTEGGQDVGASEF